MCSSLADTFLVGWRALVTSFVEDYLLLLRLAKFPRNDFVWNAASGLYLENLRIKALVLRKSRSSYLHLSFSCCTVYHSKIRPLSIEGWRAGARARQDTLFSLR